MNLGSLEGLIVILIIVGLVFEIITDKYLIDIAVEKKTKISKGVLWCIGLFARAFVLGVLVCAMPDRGHEDLTPDIPEL